MSAQISCHACAFGITYVSPFCMIPRTGMALASLLVPRTPPYDWRGPPMSFNQAPWEYCRWIRSEHERLSSFMATHEAALIICCYLLMCSLPDGDSFRANWMEFLHGMEYLKDVMDALFAWAANWEQFQWECA